MKVYGLFIVLGIVLLPRPGQAQEAALPVLSEETLYQTLRPWNYHPGDNPAWAQPDFDDSAWEILPDASFEPEQMPDGGWTGIGWFRLRFTVDSTLWERPLVVAIYIEGAAEVYLNGVLLTTYGKVGASKAEEESIISSDPNPVLREVVFDRRAEHVVAVRQSNFVAEDFYKVGGPMGGFDLVVGAPTVLAAAISKDVRAYTATQYAFTGVFLAFALFFFLLFAFYTEQRNHLYFALLALGVAMMTFLDLQLEMTTTAEHYRFLRRYFAVAGIFTFSALLYFVYALFNEVMLRRFWVFLVAMVGVGVWGWLDPFNAFTVFIILGLILLLEVFRVVAMAIWRKASGAWIVSVGLLFSIAGMGYDLLVDVGLIPELGEVNNCYYYGFVGLLMAMAMYLSRDFARTNRDLKQQIVQVKVLSEKTLEQERQRLQLEVENQRKALELEKAKELEASYRALEEAHRHLKSTQTHLIHAEKMASLGQLTAGIAHEIKNPLNFVNNFAQLSAELADELHQELDAHPDQTLAEVAGEFGEILHDIKLNAAKILEHGQRADGIVKSMLEHARPATGRRERTDVNALLDEYLDLCYHGLCTEQADFPITFERDYDEAVGQMEVAPQEIGRVFFNLLNNAFYAVQEKERVVSEVYLPMISVSTRRRNGAVEIRISDNGPGIPETLQGKIFEPFYTTKPTGTGAGLGLSISYDIVTQGHGGTMTVESDEGEGTTFVVTLPGENTT